MARNGSGTETIPNTLVSQNTITASALNQNFTDIGAEITNSVAADGQTTMTGPLKSANGTAAAPSVTFASDTDTGFFRAAANSIGIAAAGASLGSFSDAGLILSATASFILTASFSSAIKSASTSHWLAPVGTTGQRPTPAEGMFRQNSTTHSFEYYNGSAWVTVNGATSPRGNIDGCILANGADATNDITIAAGVCRDSTNTVDITVAAMTTGKQLDANWAPGDAAGMRNSAAGIANTTYHIYAVAKADSTQDIYAHTSTTVATVITALQAESGGASYVYARRIGSIVRSGATILAFTQYGDRFGWVAPPQDTVSTNAGTSAVLRTLTVPAGIKVLAELAVDLSAGSNYQYLLVSSPDETDVAASAAAFTLRSVVSGTASTIDATGVVNIRTNTSSQVRTRQSASGANDSITILTRGYTDSRGKDA